MVLFSLVSMIVDPAVDESVGPDSGDAICQLNDLRVRNCSCDRSRSRLSNRPTRGRDIRQNSGVPHGTPLKQPTPPPN